MTEYLNIPDETTNNEDFFELSFFVLLTFSSSMMVYDQFSDLRIYFLTLVVWLITG